jgi:hypothetical protein
MKANKQVQTTPSLIVIENSLPQIPQSAITKEPASAKERLLKAEGGFLVSEKAAKLIGITQVELEKNRQAEKIIGLPTNDGEYVYPKWQFVKKFLWGHQILPNLDKVLSEFPAHDPWVQAAFMLNDSTPAGFKNPLDGLKAGKLSQVLSLARCFGEHGAG